MKRVPISAESPRACRDCMSLGTLALKPQKRHLWKNKWNREAVEPEDSEVRSVSSALRTVSRVLASKAGPELNTPLRPVVN